MSADRVPYNRDIGQKAVIKVMKILSNQWDSEAFIAEPIKINPSTNKDSGLCYGISNMARQAILLDKMDEFDDRCILIDRLSQRLEQVEKEILATMSSTERSEMNEKNQNIWEMKTLEERHELIKKELEKLVPSPDRTNQMFVDLLAFYDGVRLYQAIKNSPFLFDDDKPKVQSESYARPLGMSKELEEKGIHHVNEKRYDLELMSSLSDLNQAEEGKIYLSENSSEYYVKGMSKPASIPKKIDLMDLPTKLNIPSFKNSILAITSKAGHTREKVVFSRGYENSEISEMLSRLKVHIDKKFPEGKPASMVLSSINHAITIGYNPLTQNFTFVDSNNLPSKKSASPDVLMGMIQEAFSSDKEEIGISNIFSVQMYTRDDSDPSYKAGLLEWMEKEKQISLEEGIVARNAKLITDYGSSCLLVAAKVGDVEAIEALVKSGADVNHASDIGTPLFLAMSSNQKIEVFQALINAKADVNKDHKGSTLLSAAVGLGRADVVSELIDAQANVDIGFKNTGETPLFLAAQSGDSKIVDILLSKKADPSLTFKGEIEDLRDLAQSEKKRLSMEDLIKRKASPSSSEIDMTSLDMAIVMGHIDIVERLSSPQELYGTKLLCLMGKIKNYPYEQMKKYSEMMPEEDLHNRIRYIIKQIEPLVNLIEPFVASKDLIVKSEDYDSIMSSLKKELQHNTSKNPSNLDPSSSSESEKNKFLMDKLYKEILDIANKPSVEEADKFSSSGPSNQKDEIKSSADILLTLAKAGEVDTRELTLGPIPSLESDPPKDLLNETKEPTEAKERISPNEQEIELESKPESMDPNPEEVEVRSFKSST